MIVSAAYVWTFTNIAIYGVYFFLYLTGHAAAPSTLPDTHISFGLMIFNLMIVCIALPLLCWFGLYCRYKFDLMRMCDGTSAPSRFIWTTLNLMANATLSHLFADEILLWY